MDNFMIAFIVLLVFILIGRAINEKANKKLEQDKKAALIDLFAGGRIYTFGILIGIIALYFAAIKWQLIDPLLAYIFYLIALLVFLIVNGYSSYKKLQVNQFPEFYIKSFILSTTIRFIGLIIFVTLTMMN